MQRILLLALPLFFLLFNSADAQRNLSYEQLRAEHQQPGIQTEFLSLPGVDGNALFMVSFRIDYTLLPFRRVQSSQSAPADAEFYTTGSMRLEVFRGTVSNSGGNFEPVARSAWEDTAWAADFEETQSGTDHLEGAITLDLNPGEYNLFLDFNRGGSQQNARSRERSFEIPDFATHEKGVITLLHSLEESENEFRGRLLNHGGNSLYGRDFTLIALLPARPAHDTYHLKIEKMRAGSDSETEGSPLYEQVVHTADLLYTSGFSPDSGSQEPLLGFTRTEEGYPLLITTIPNSQFPNDRTQITLTAAGEEEPLATRIIQSRWPNMPVSLLNLDVAIDMLSPITDSSTLRDMKRGTRSERERRFREFWAERDPTPETEYNELMAEYYRRIDEAYDSFTTLENAGYETDQGQAHILYGAPNRKERTYPTNRPTREVWYYNNRTLVFEATSGFGDFRLVEQ